MYSRATNASPADLFHIAFPKDSWIPKTIEYTIYILETIQTILVTHDGYKYFAEGFGNVETLNKTQLEWIAVPTISGIGGSTPLPFPTS